MVAGDNFNSSKIRGKSFSMRMFLVLSLLVVLSDSFHHENYCRLSKSLHYCRTARQVFSVSVKLKQQEGHDPIPERKIRFQVDYDALLNRNKAVNPITRIVKSLSAKNLSSYDKIQFAREMQDLIPKLSSSDLANVIYGLSSVKLPSRSKVRALNYFPSISHLTRF